MTELNFDATQIQPQSSFDPIPAGKYTAIIEASEMKATKDGQGAYLEVVHQVIDGEHAGRKIWARLNLQNKNQQAVDIAQAQLSSICHACDFLKVSDSSELHDKPMVIKVKIRKQSGYDPTNEITGWEKLETAGGQPVPVPPSTPAPAVQTPEAPQGTGQPPVTPAPAVSAPVNNSEPAKKPWEK